MPLLEEGTYFGRLVEIGTDRLGNEAKTPYVYVSWDVTHRAVDSQWVAMGPTTRESRWWTSEKAEPYTMDRLQRLGFNGDFDHPEFTASPHPERDGVQLVCRHDVRDGKAYENWDLADMRSERERTPWDTDAKLRFKAKYKTRLSTQKKPQGAPSAPPARREPDNSPIRDEEIPMDADADEVADVPEDQIPY